MQGILCPAGDDLLASPHCIIILPCFPERTSFSVRVAMSGITNTITLLIHHHFILFYLFHRI